MCSASGNKKYVSVILLNKCLSFVTKKKGAVRHLGCIKVVAFVLCCVGYTIKVYYFPYVFFVFLLISIGL